MAKGTAAFVVMLAVTMTITMLGAIGFYAELGVDYDGSDHNADVENAADALVGQEAQSTGSSLLEEFTASGGNALQVGWQVLSNTSGVLQLLFSVPKTAADLVQTFFQIMFGVTFAGFIRGVIVD